MNKNISKIPQYFRIEKLRNDKRIAIYLVCVLIATALWFLNALSKDYSTTISYPVKYVNPPNHQFLSNQPPSKLDLKVDAHGFTLLRYKLSLSYSPIVLNLGTITKNEVAQNGVYRIQTSDLMRRIKSQVSNEISVNEIQPEVISIVLDSLKTKSVPVKSNFNLEFRPQYNLQKPIQLSPRQVKVTGPSAIIDTVQSLQLERLTLKELDQNMATNVKVLHPDKTEVNPEKVLVTIEIEKYTEKEIKVPILVKNKPDGISVKLFPSDVKVTCLVGLSEFENVNSNDFSAVVDYNDVTKESRSLNVKIEQKSSFIQLVRFSPESVEYLTETD
ncbi:MAG TPA: CdaR family protein [Draconibacterium sp.]|nr:CdaR family protein [Draconibacterium sp.]